MKHAHLLQKIANHNAKPYPRALGPEETDTCPFCDSIVTVRWHFTRTRWACKECADWAVEHRVKAQKHSTTQYLKKAQQCLIRRATPAELCVMEKLSLAGVPFEFQCIVRYRTWQGICDFYLPSFECMVEVDGGVHESEEQQAKDRIKDYFCAVRLRKPVIRITNEQAFEFSAERLVEFITARKPLPANAGPVPCAPIVETSLQRPLLGIENESCKTSNYGSEHQAKDLNSRKVPQPSQGTDGSDATAAIQPSIHENKSTRNPLNFPASGQTQPAKL